MPEAPGTSGAVFGVVLTLPLVPRAALPAALAVVPGAR